MTSSAGFRGCVPRQRVPIRLPGTRRRKPAEALRRTRVLYDPGVTPRPNRTGAPAPTGSPEVVRHQPRAAPTRGNRGGGHLRGKLVVMALILLGIALGVVGLQYRVLMPRKAATQPTAPPPVRPPASQPG